VVSKTNLQEDIVCAVICKTRYCLHNTMVK